MNIPKEDEFATDELIEVVEKYKKIMDIIQSTTSHKGVLLSMVLHVTLNEFVKTIKEKISDDYYTAMYYMSQGLKQKYIDKEEDSENE